MNYHVTGKYDFDVVYSEQLKKITLEQWRMNLLAVSWNLHFLFVAGGHHIYVYPILPNAQIDQNSEVQKLTVSGELEGPINQIMVKSFEGYDTLFCVDMNAKLTVFKYIQKAFVRIQLDNVTPSHDDSSTWSLDVTDEQNKCIAVGSNAYTISLWDDKLNRRVISAHDHNVPAVQFSPCGEFVASVSIDKSVRVFHVKTLKKVCQYPLLNWGWSLNWVVKSKVLGYYKKDEKEETLELSTIAEQIKKYLLFVTDEVNLYLIDPLSDKKNVDIEDASYKPYNMKLLSQYVYNRLKVTIKYMHGRYNYCKFIQNQSLVILAAQNTPFLHLIKIVYNSEVSAFSLGDDSCAIFKRAILGLAVIEKPDESILLNTVYVYTLLEDKKIELIQIKLKNQLHSFKALLDSDALY